MKREQMGRAAFWFGFVLLVGFWILEGTSFSEESQAKQSKPASWPEIQIVSSEADDQAEMKTAKPLVEGEAVQLSELNQRSDKVSQYGTFAVVEKPVGWFGKALDGMVAGIGKLGSVFIDYPAKLLKKKSSSK